MSRLPSSTQSDDPPPLPTDLGRIACGFETVELVAWAREARVHYMRRLIRAGLAQLQSRVRSIGSALRPSASCGGPDPLCSDAGPGGRAGLTASSVPSRPHTSMLRAPSSA
jgi:hypothetical protein